VSLGVLQTLGTLGGEKVKSLAAVLALLLVMPSGMPVFEDYPAEAPLAGKQAQPKLASARARRYRTQLTRAAGGGVNFNGHYAIAHWGCGSNCMEWAVIDLASGDVWWGPIQGCAVGRLHNGEEPSWIDSRVSSSLFFTYQCQIGDPCPEEAMVREQAWTWDKGAARSVGVACVPE